MSEKFKNFYLVCLDHDDDINYVVARNPSLQEARKIAGKAKKEWPDKNVYITLEKVPVKNPFGQVLDSINEMGLSYNYTGKKKNPSTTKKCICGNGYGACVGELGCRCSALASCKRVDKVTENPLPFQEDTVAPRKKRPKLSPATLEVIKVFRGMIEAAIPEWAPDEIFGISLDEIPSNLHSKLKVGEKFSVLASLAVTDPEDMVIEFNPVKNNPIPEESNDDDLDDEEDDDWDDEEDDLLEDDESDEDDDSDEEDGFDDLDEDEDEEDLDETGDEEDFEEAGVESDESEYVVNPDLEEADESEDESDEVDESDDDK